jgi:RNA-binding protein
MGRADVAVGRDPRCLVWQLAAMLAPTSPRKQSLMPSTPLRRLLRASGHALQAIVQIGKGGTNPAVIAQVARALFDHELVKVKLARECPETRFEVAERLGDGPGVNVVQILGNTILLYKRHPKHPHFEGEAAVR